MRAQALAAAAGVEAARTDQPLFSTSAAVDATDLKCAKFAAIFSRRERRKGEVLTEQAVAHALEKAAEERNAAVAEAIATMKREAADAWRAKVETAVSEANARAALQMAKVREEAAVAQEMVVSVAVRELEERAESQTAEDRYPTAPSPSKADCARTRKSAVRTLSLLPALTDARGRRLWLGGRRWQHRLGRKPWSWQRRWKRPSTPWHTSSKRQWPRHERRRCSSRRRPWRRLWRRRGSALRTSWLRPWRVPYSRRARRRRRRTR
jgi:hypothetical protein